MGEAGEAAERKGSLLAVSTARPSTEHGSKKAASLHGASALTSLLILGGGYPQCPASLTGSQENRFGLWNFSSISLKGSGIPHSDFFGPLTTFAFTGTSLCESG